MKKIFTSFAAVLVACTSLFAQDANQTWGLVGLFNNWLLESPLYFTSNGNGTYTATADEFRGDFKILRANTSGAMTWSLAWGLDAATTLNPGEEMQAILGGSANILLPEDVRYTNVTFTLTEGSNPEIDPVTISFTGTAQAVESTFELVGEFNNWTIGGDAACYFEDKGNGLWQYTYEGDFEGAFKISKNGTWTAYYNVPECKIGETYQLAAPADAEGNIIPLESESPWVNPTFTLNIHDDLTADFTVTVDNAGVEGIEADENVPAVYYNLQGIRVENPENGLFIKKAGSKVEKVFVNTLK